MHTAPWRALPATTARRLPVPGETAGLDGPARRTGAPGPTGECLDHVAHTSGHLRSPCVTRLAPAAAVRKSATRPASRERAMAGRTSSSTVAPRRCPAPVARLPARPARPRQAACAASRRAPPSPLAAACSASLRATSASAVTCSTRRSCSSWAASSARRRSRAFVSAAACRLAVLATASSARPADRPPDRHTAS